MKYRVEYHPDRWKRLAPGYLYAQSHNGFSEVQTVRRDLSDKVRLSVELRRKANGSIEVAVARLDVRRNDRGRERFGTAKFLEPADLELVAGKPPVPS